MKNWVNSSKRILAVVLSVAMLLTVASTTVFADPINNLPLGDLNDQMNDEDLCSHKFTNCEQTECGYKGCTFTREAIAHKYSDCEDTTCNNANCNETRKAIAHKYTNCEDTTCNTCGKTRKALAHKYTNCTVTSCNTCGKTRKAPGHKYTNACDTSCNVCKAKRSIKHDYETRTTAATLKKNGKIIKVCSVCEKESSEKPTTIYYAKTVKLSSTTLTFTGKSLTPKVTIKDSKGKTISSKYYTLKYSKNKSVGEASVKVTFKGRYKDSKTLYFKINPKKTSISSLKAGKKAFTVKYSKQTSGSGYEIQYSTSKSFKGAKTKTVKSNKTTSLTVKKLSGKKTYYVRVRTVKGSYKSEWSNAKKVTTKK